MNGTAVFVCTSPKTETLSSRTTLVGAAPHPFSRPPRFTRKHYEQATRNHGKSQSLILSYDVGKDMGDTFFNLFLPDLGLSLNQAFPQANLLRAPGAHAGIFNSIERGKYLNHFINGIPGSEQAYTYNLDLNRLAIPGIEVLEALPVMIPGIGDGNFHFMEASISHRPHAPIPKPNELNLTFKFAFQKTGDDQALRARFSNDIHNRIEIIMNIHFSRTPGNNNPADRIVNQASLRAFLSSAFGCFNPDITAELTRLPDLMNLNIDHIDEVSAHPTLPAGTIRGRFQGPAPVPTPQGTTWRYTRARLPNGFLLDFLPIWRLYQPNCKNASAAPPPVVARVYHTSTNPFGALAVDDDPTDLVDIMP